MGVSWSRNNGGAASTEASSSSTATGGSIEMKGESRHPKNQASAFWARGTSRSRHKGETVRRASSFSQRATNLAERAILETFVKANAQTKLTVRSAIPPGLYLLLESCRAGCKARCLPAQRGIDWCAAVTVFPKRRGDITSHPRD